MIPTYYLEAMGNKEDGKIEDTFHGEQPELDVTIVQPSISNGSPLQTTRQFISPTNSLAHHINRLSYQVLLVAVHFKLSRDEVFEHLKRDMQMGLG